MLDLAGGALVGSGGIFNNGQIQLQSITSTISGGSLDNLGLLAGTGQINSALNNQATGQVSVGAADTMRFTGGGNGSAGRITLGGGTVAFNFDLSNSGTISGRGTLQIANLINSGTMNFSSGSTDVYGGLTNSGRITITGGSTTTFYNDVNTSAGSISVGTNSTAVFFGNVTGQDTSPARVIKGLRRRHSAAPRSTAPSGDTYVGTPANVTTKLFNEDNIQISGNAAVATDPG